MKTLKKIRDIVLSPFESNLPEFISLWILAAFAHLYFYAIQGNVVFGTYMALHGLLISYLLILLYRLVTQSTKKYFKIGIFTLGSFNLLLDIGVYSVLGCGFTMDLVAVFLGTNGKETLEFLEMYVNSKMLITSFLFFLFSIIAYILTKKIQTKITRIFSYMSFVFTILCACVIFGRGSKNWESVFIMKLQPIICYEKTSSLAEHRKSYDVILNKKAPQNVVVIIGESLNKCQMSIYGYPLKTTPFLDSLQNSKNMVVFDNVTSTATATIQAFVYMMTSTTVDSDFSKWKDTDYMLDIVKSSGYNSMWISNQSPSGVYDNVVARFAELSDSIYWCGNKHMGICKTDLDEEVLVPLTKRIQDEGSKKFTIVHLMGSHERFSSRYPKNFNVFNEKNYQNRPKHQRIPLSEYDNSVLYNDYVVKKIIDICKNKESIVFYFSDHSIDVFNSSDDYIGHSRTDKQSIKAGQNIPFLIYMSDEFISGYPDLVQRINNAKKKAYKTDNIMYSILDAMGVLSINNNNIKQYSIF